MKKELVSADFTNIEGRVNAWLAGEAWKLQAFRDFDAGTGPDLYLLAAAQINGVHHSAYNKKSPERQHGKVSELACGYQGGVGAFQKMAKTYLVKIEDALARKIVTGWRSTNPAITQSWWDYDGAAIAAVRDPGTVHRCCGDRISFTVRGPFLLMQLPSGRRLYYARPVIEEHKREVPLLDEITGEQLAELDADGNIVMLTKTLLRQGVSFWGVDPDTKRWAKAHAYGGLWCENAVQAVARDIMAEAMLRVTDAGYPVILTVHDEIVAEVDRDFGGRAYDKAEKTEYDPEFERLMSIIPPWAQGCPIVAHGWRGFRYRK